MQPQMPNAALVVAQGRWHGCSSAAPPTDGRSAPVTLMCVTAPALVAPVDDEVVTLGLRVMASSMAV